MNKTSLSTATLEAYAETVKQGHIDVLKGPVVILDHAVTVGKALRAAKAGMKHGEFTPWIEQECGIAHRTANAYMQIASKAIEGKIDPLALLCTSLRKALAPPDEVPDPPKALAPPEVPPKVLPSPKEKSKDEEKKEPKQSTGASVRQTVKDGKELFSVTLNEIQRMRREVKKLSQTELGRFLVLTQVDSALVNAYTALKFAMPYARCPYCAKPDGKQEGCRVCVKGGWVSRGLHRDAPAKLKKMAEKGGGN